MLSIQKGSPVDTAIIRDIAYRTWPDTYGNIVPAAQLKYMLELFYSDEALTAQMEEKGHQFILVKENETVLGFASYEHHYLGQNTTRLHKIYLLPESQGKGAGKLLIDSVVKVARENQSEVVSLNVNGWILKLLSLPTMVKAKPFTDSNIKSQYQKSISKVNIKSQYQKSISKVNIKSQYQKSISKVKVHCSKIETLYFLIFRIWF